MKGTTIPVAVALAVSIPQLCCGQSDGHKSDIEVKQMTPEQRVREYCGEFLRHGLVHRDYDRAIGDTLQLRYKIGLSEKDLLDFSNYLIAQDPRYPTWSEPDWYVDQNKLNDAG